MSGNTSATGGYLRQINQSPTDDQIIDMVTGAVTGIIGMSGAMVRPRWQQNPPREPDPGTDWCAVGFASDQPRDYPAILHSAGGPDTLTRWDTIHLLISMYGPNAFANTRALRDGLYIWQNLEQLATLGLKLMDAGDATVVPETFGLLYYNRVDMTLRLAVGITRTYAVLDIASVGGTITSEQGVASQFNVIFEEP